MVPEHWQKSLLETPLLQQFTHLLPSQNSSIPKSSVFNCRSTKTSPAYLHRFKEIFMGLHLCTNINGQLINALFSLLNRQKRQLLLAEKTDLTLQPSPFNIQLFDFNTLSSLYCSVSPYSASLCPFTACIVQELAVFWLITRFLKLYMKHNSSRSLLLTGLG